MKLKIKATGRSDYLQHRFDIDEAEMQGIKKKKSLAEDSEAPIEKYTYKDKSGCYIPREHFERAIQIASGKCIKKGRASWMSDFISGTFIEEDKIRFIPNKKSFDEVHRTQGRIPPRTGGRVVISRPLFKGGWVAEFVLSYDEDDIPKNIVEEVINIAGEKIGIGDWRPKFGRFEAKVSEVK